MPELVVIYKTKNACEFVEAEIASLSLPFAMVIFGVKRVNVLARQPEVAGLQMAHSSCTRDPLGAAANRSIASARP